MAEVFWINEGDGSLGDQTARCPESASAQQRWQTVRVTTNWKKSNKKLVAQADPAPFTGIHSLDLGDGVNPPVSPDADNGATSPPCSTRQSSPATGIELVRQQLAGLRYFVHSLRAALTVDCCVIQDTVTYPRARLRHDVTHVTLPF